MRAPEWGGAGVQGAEVSGAGAQALGGWDLAAAAAYYQNQGWGGYYGMFLPHEVDRSL